jgi:hypothetical protein
MLVSLIIAGLVLWQGVRPTWLTLAVIPLILAGWHSYDRLSTFLQRLYTAFLIIVIVAFGIRIGDVIARNLGIHEDGDFKGFWVSARVGLERGNFYDPERYYQVAAQLDPRDVHEEFNARYLDTTFWYPPPSILHFLPLGLFDLHTAWIVNYLYLIALFILLVWLLKNTFWPNGGIIALGAVAALLVVNYPTGLVFQFSQTNFILLVFLLLMWRAREQPRAGMWLALAISVKPLVAALALFLLLQKRWRAILSLVLTLGILSIITLVIYGSETFFGYSPTSKLPLEVYNESINQSLLATILRITDYELVSSQSPLFHPVFLMGALILTAITAWIVYRLPGTENRWALALLIPFALLIYPTTLHHYGVFLILPLLLIWSEREKFPGGMMGALLFITFEYLLLSFNSGELIFVPIMICWMVVAAVCLTRLRASSLPG